MAAASAEKKRIVSRVFRAGSGLSLTSLPAARGEALPLKFADGGMLREEAAPAPNLRVFWRGQPSRARPALSGLALSEETAGILEGELLFPVRRQPKTRANHGEMPPFFLV